MTSTGELRLLRNHTSRPLRSKAAKTRPDNFFVFTITAVSNPQSRLDFLDCFGHGHQHHFPRGCVW